MDNQTIMIGQKLVTGFPGTEMSPEFISAVKEGKIANVILFAHNIAGKEQLSSLCASIQELVRNETGHDAFITIDQEGGMVTRLSPDCANIPGAMAIASTGDPENAYRAGLLTARELAALGISFNLAPVLDINTNKHNPVIGVRSYGDTASTVARYGVRMMEGLRDGGVLSAAKHFPGHGDTNIDSHVNLPRIDKTLDELMADELVPFKAAIDAGIPAVMSSHILFPRIEKDGVPATMSRAIMTGLLKEKLGFTGLVISDCMEMAAIKQFYGTVEGTVAAVQAGVDLVFISHSPLTALSAARAIKEGIAAGKLSAAEITASARTILALKDSLSSSSRKKHSLENSLGKDPLASVGSDEHMRIAQDIRAASLSLVAQHGKKIPLLGEHPVFLGCRAFRATNVTNANVAPLTFPGWMAEKTGGIALDTPDDPTPEEIAKVVATVQALQTGYREARPTALVAGTYNGHLFPGQMKLVGALAELDLPLTVVALRNPYDLASLPEKAVGIAAFEYSVPAFAAVLDVLTGRSAIRGHLSITL